MSLSSKATSTLRRLSRFRLRTLLVLIAVLCVWLTVQMQSARRQASAVRAIQDAGGSVQYDFEYAPSDTLSAGVQVNGRRWEPKWLQKLVGIDFFHTVVAVNFGWREDGSGVRIENRESTDAICVHLTELPHLKRLILQGKQATDDAMVHVATLHDLEELLICEFNFDGVSGSRPPVTETGIARLQGLTQLRWVHVYGATLTDASLETFGKLQQLENLAFAGQANQFTDRGLKSLEQLTRLRSLTFPLGIGANEFSDTGLAHLRNLENLERLQVRGAGISDRGLEQLAALPRLRQLIICTNAVTPQGIRRFKQALPKARCTISPYQSYHQAVRVIVAQQMTLDRELVRPGSTLSELGCTAQQRADLVARITDFFFGLDPAGGEAFARRVAAEDDPKISTLGDILQATAGH